MIKIKLYRTNGFIKHYTNEEIANQECSKKRFENNTIGAAQAIPETCIPINSKTQKECTQMAVIQNLQRNETAKKSIKQFNLLGKDGVW